MGTLTFLSGVGGRTCLALVVPFLFDYAHKVLGFMFAFLLNRCERLALLCFVPLNYFGVGQNSPRTQLFALFSLTTMGCSAIFHSASGRSYFLKVLDVTVLNTQRRSTVLVRYR